MSPGIITVTCLLLVVACCLANSMLAAERESSKSSSLTKKWTVLHRGKKSSKGKTALPKDSSIEVLQGFELQGPGPADVNRIGKFRSTGEWSIVNGLLQRTKGTDTAIKLGQADNFELEGMVNAEGLGGWFMLIGWYKQHGYLIYNVTLKKGSSPWIIAELRNAKGIDSTHREIKRFDWKGIQPFRMSVVDGKLNLQVGKTLIAENLALPNYAEGDIIFGTYKTQYGPKPVKIRSLRIRAK